MAEADASAEQRKAELNKMVEEKRRLQEVEKLRASDLAKAEVEAEITIKVAQGKAEAIATKLTAEANLVAMTNEANGIIALREAEAKGLQELIKSAGGVEGLNSYLMIRDNQLKDIAKYQSDGVHGMKPNIIVVTGAQENGLVNTMNQMLHTGLPLLNNIKEKYGVDLLGNYKFKN